MQKHPLHQLNTADFESIINGKPTGLYTLINKNGTEATFTNYGQRLVSLYVSDSMGNMEDIVLGFSTLKEYQESKNSYFGATIGRYGNRIAKGQFILDSICYKLHCNDGENHIHGGHKGFHDVVWDVSYHTANTLEFFRVSEDMEEGYPGRLEVTIRYLLMDNDTLTITYDATTDKTTHVNLTHHSFFNLAGVGTINDHMMMINADQYTPIDEALIPTGEIVSVKNTPFDFRIPKAIGKDLTKKHQQLIYGQGYDHNFVLNKTLENNQGLPLAAKIIDPKSRRTMEVYTNEPGLQCYGGNFLNGETLGKNGKPFLFRGAFCLETQHFPNSPNQPNFPSTILQPGERYHSVCSYKFSVS